MVKTIKNKILVTILAIIMLFASVMCVSNPINVEASLSYDEAREFYFALNQEIFEEFYFDNAEDPDDIDYMCFIIDSSMFYEIDYITIYNTDDIYSLNDTPFFQALGLVLIAKMGRTPDIFMDSQGIINVADVLDLIAIDIFINFYGTYDYLNVITGEEVLSMNTRQELFDNSHITEDSDIITLDYNADWGNTVQRKFYNFMSQLYNTHTPNLCDFHALYVDYNPQSLPITLHPELLYYLGGA